MENSNKSEKVIVVTPTKSVGISLLLTFFFGPIGMLYSTVSGAIIMFIISCIVGIFTLGVGLFITWPICMIWGAIAANNYNKKITIQQKD
ncbi:hypothetical protein [Riemerella columbina]|uniref:hypothetical protein n=1 Tax=Riemerella columbina TaxID=103810 RepID=UPI00036249A9|nr:hypothetical protein [Riemerella columbina]